MMVKCGYRKLFLGELDYGKGLAGKLAQDVRKLIYDLYCHLVKILYNLDGRRDRVGTFCTKLVFFPLRQLRSSIIHAFLYRQIFEKRFHRYQRAYPHFASPKKIKTNEIIR